MANVDRDRRTAKIREHPAQPRRRMDAGDPDRYSVSAHIAFFADQTASRGSRCQRAAGRYSQVHSHQELQHGGAGVVRTGMQGTGYLLGRLFAVYEQIQTAALGRNVNATIKDKFYGAASAQPRKVFRMLDAGSANK